MESVAGEMIEAIGIRLCRSQLDAYDGGTRDMIYQVARASMNSSGKRLQPGKLTSRVALRSAE